MSAGAAALRRTSAIGHRAPRTLALSSRISQAPALSRSLISSASALRTSSLSKSSPLNRQISKFSTMSPLQAAPVLEREYDPEIKDMADYIHNYKVDSELAVRSSPKQK